MSSAKSAVRPMEANVLEVWQRLFRRVAPSRAGVMAFNIVGVMNLQMRRCQTFFYGLVNDKNCRSS